MIIIVILIISFTAELSATNDMCLFYIQPKSAARLKTPSCVAGLRTRLTSLTGLATVAGRRPLEPVRQTTTRLEPFEVLSPAVAAYTSRT